MNLETFLELPYRGANTVINTVLGSTDLSHIPSKVLENAGIRGSRVHESIEEYINTGKFNIDLEYSIYMDYFLDWVKDYSPNFVFSELMLYSEELGYKGIIDAGFYTTKYGKTTFVVCDWKTSSNLDVLRASIQVTLYIKLLKHCMEYHPERCEGISDIDFSNIELRVLSLGKQGYTYYNLEYDEKTADAILHLYHKIKK